MASSFPNSSNLKPTTLVFTQPVNNSFTINGTSSIRPGTTSNGTIVQSIPTSIVNAPTSIVRLNQPLVNAANSQLIPQTVWTTNANGSQTAKIQYSTAIKTEPLTTTVSQQPTIVPTTIVATPVGTTVGPRQPAPTTGGQKLTEQQINDFVAKCRTFLLTLLRLAEKQAPDKLPMVRSCIQDLLNGTIDPESFTQRLHTLYKSQPHTSLVPFFKLALPYMRQIVKRVFGEPITIELLEKLNITTSTNSSNNTVTRTSATPTTSCVVVNPSLLSQTSANFQQTQQPTPVLYTTVQTQQKINLLQQTPPGQTLFGSTTSLLGQQQQQQQQARAQISISNIRPIITTVSSSSNTNILASQTPNIQPVTQTIIPQSDSLLQRTYLTATSTNLQQAQIITVNPQPIKTEISSNTPSITISTSGKPLIKSEVESSDNQTSNLNSDDRQTRHIHQEKRLINSSLIRRRFDNLMKNNQRWDGGSMMIHDDAVLALISHSAEERLKYLIDQIRSVVKKRLALKKVKSTNDSNEDESLFDDVSMKRKRSSEEILNEQNETKSKKRQKNADRRDMLTVMENDKQLRRSSVYFKAIDQFNSN